MQVEAMHSTVRHKCISIKKKIIFEVSTMQIEVMHSTVKHKVISIEKNPFFDVLQMEHFAERSF